MSMRQWFSCLILLLLAPLALATESPYYPSHFQDEISTGLRDGALKKALFQILSQTHIINDGGPDTLGENCPAGRTCYRHQSLGYATARRYLFGRLHLRQLESGYAIRDEYCQRVITTQDFTSQPPGPGQIPDPTVLNAEHTWPQSRFSSRFSRDLQKSDLHILYPVASRANSSRGNDEFGNVVSVLSQPCLESKRGYGPQGNKVIFEVPPVHRGNVARAVFYFSIRYDLRISASEEDSLKAWHREDPVDADELSRNAAIHDLQKIRNPFIDHPELVELISDF